MSVIWPLSLPQEMLVADLDAEFPEGAIRTQMDAGEAKARMRYSAAPERRSGTILVDSDQLATLREFWRDSIRMGSVAFEWKDPVDNAAAIVRLLQPPTLRPRTSRMVARGVFEVSLAIEVLAAAVAPASPDPGNAQVSEEVAWGPWYRGLEDSPAGESDPSFRGASIESTSAGGGGDGGMSGVPGAAAGTALGTSHGGGIVINFG